MAGLLLLGCWFYHSLAKWNVDEKVNFFIYFEKSYKRNGMDSCCCCYFTRKKGEERNVVTEWFSSFNRRWQGKKQFLESRMNFFAATVARWLPCGTIGMHLWLSSHTHKQASKQASERASKQQNDFFLFFLYFHLVKMFNVFVVCVYQFWWPTVWL